MTPILQSYLALERTMLVLSKSHSDIADTLRDAMDPLWYSLSDAERQMLNEREVGEIKTLEEIRVPISGGVFEKPMTPAHFSLPEGPIRGWKAVA